MARTYIENQNLSALPKEYSEESLREKFAARDAEIKSKIGENLQSYSDLRKDDVFEDSFNFPKDADADKERSAGLRMVRDETEKLRKEGEELYRERLLLDQYGSTFSKLYYIKDFHEKAGERAKISFTEVDVTDGANYDTLTDGQYFGAIADPEGKVKQLALTVTEDDVVFNLGMMEFHKPNSAPEVKMQISFEEEALQDLDAEKVKKIMEFCENHGIASSDMIVRRFDGTIDEGEIQSKLERIIEEAKALKEQEAQKTDDELKSLSEPREAEIVSAVQELKEQGVLPQSFKEKEDWKTVVSDDEPLNSELGSATASPNETPVEAKETSVQGQQPTPAQAPAQNQPQAPVQTPAQTGQTPQQAPGAQSATVPQQQKNNVFQRVKEYFTKKEDTEQTRAEAQMTEFIEEGLGKRRNRSYFKTHTLGGWTQYTIYDTEDWQNRMRDGLRENGGPAKFTYNFKLFVRETPSGEMEFAYRTPHNKKLDEGIINGLAGQFKAMGYTHVNFPKGLSDAEKTVWRKALAEQGIVPIGIGLDRAKANGMIKAAQEKLSDEALSKFKYRLALQMDANNRAKHKTPDRSEQEFIDTLLKAHKYEAFTIAYADFIKSELTQTIHPNRERPDGAVDKIAAMRNLRRLFNSFKDGVEAGNILASTILTDSERNQLRATGLSAKSPENMTSEDILRIYQILLPQSKAEAKQKLDEKFREPGAKRAHEVIKKGVFNSVYNNCKSIVKELKAMGLSEIDLPETTDELPYTHYPQPQQQNQPQQNQPQTQPQQNQPQPRTTNINTGSSGR